MEGYAYTRAKLDMFSKLNAYILVYSSQIEAIAGRMVYMPALHRRKKQEQYSILAKAFCKMLVKSTPGLNRTVTFFCVLSF